MPHGHGGGSSGGGSFSHSSSHGGGGGSSQRYSRRYFSGAKRFRYYGFGGRERYIYCSQAPTPLSIGGFILELFFALIFVLSGFIIVFFAITECSPPQKLSAQCAGYGNHIVDNISVIDNKAQLEQTLNEFESKTGICPCIVTVNHEYWQVKYADIEQAAFNEYVTRFVDEQHFLILYSAASKSPETNWAWYDMSGDDTDRIITNSHFKKFQKDLQSGLSSSGSSVGAAFDAAFKNACDYMMDGSLTEEGIMLIVMAVFWWLCTGLLVFSFVSTFVRSRRKYEEVPETSDLQNTESSVMSKFKIK